MAHYCSCAGPLLPSITETSPSLLTSPPPPRSTVEIYLLTIPTLAKVPNRTILLPWSFSPTSDPPPVSHHAGTPPPWLSSIVAASVLWQNQPELHRLKYASPLSRAPTYFKWCNPLACRVASNHRYRIK
jgi:hypothetical protein